MSTKTQIAQAVSNSYKPRYKITKQAKSEVLIYAWKIRKNAAQELHCNATEILMSVCLKIAHRLKDFSNKEDEKKAHTATLVKNFFNGEKPDPKKKLKLSQFKGIILEIPNGQERIKKTKPIIDNEDNTVKRFGKIAADKYETRLYLHFIMKNDKYIIACNGHQFGAKPRRTIAPQGCIFVNKENEEISQATLESLTIKDIDQTIMKFLDDPEVESIYRINATRLIAYLENVKSLEKLIEIKDIRIPIQIGEITRGINLDYLLNALKSCGEFNHRVNISFVQLRNEYSTTTEYRLKISNLAGEIHQIMPIRDGEKSIIPTLKLDKPVIMNLNNIETLIHV